MSEAMREALEAGWKAYCEAPTARDMGRSKVEAAIKAALSGAQQGAAPQPAQVPEGWRLVPVEPTTEMLGEGAIALFAQSREPLSSAYRSMLAAAPRCPMLTAAPSGDASLTETARAFDAAPDDAEFGPDHPVFKLAAERDALLLRVRALESGDAKPVPTVLHCPECEEIHVDEGE